MYAPNVGMHGVYKHIALYTSVLATGFYVCISSYICDLE